MIIKDALVGIGGTGSRLRRDGVDVPLSKAFLALDGEPLLHWSLRRLATAGVDNIVIVGDSSEKIVTAEKVVAKIEGLFSSVNFVQDEGKGAHGLPYHAKHLLPNDFIVECGHAINTATHLKKLTALKTEDTVVFSGFIPRVGNPRQPVRVTNNGLELASDPVLFRANHSHDSIALAHPMVVDQRYAEQLPHLGFDILNILREYIQSNRMRYVMCDMPPEFDIRTEMDETMQCSRELIRAKKV